MGTRVPFCPGHLLYVYPSLCPLIFKSLSNSHDPIKQKMATTKKNLRRKNDELPAQHLKRSGCEDVVAAFRVEGYGPVIEHLWETKHLNSLISLSSFLNKKQGFLFSEYRKQIKTATIDLTQTKHKQGVLYVVINDAIQ